MLRFHPPDFSRQISSLGLELSKLARQAGEPRDPSVSTSLVPPWLPYLGSLGLDSVLRACVAGSLLTEYSPQPHRFFSVGECHPSLASNINIYVSFKVELWEDTVDVSPV